MAAVTNEKKNLNSQTEDVSEFIMLLKQMSDSDRSGSGSSCASGAEDTDGIKRQEVKRNATCLHYIIRDLLHGDSSHHYAIADRRR